MPVINPYGISVFCGSAGLDPNFSLVGGTTVLAQDLYHRLITTQGTLVNFPDYGGNLLYMLSMGVTSTSLGVIQMSLQNQCLEDQRVNSAVVNTSFETITSTLTVNILITPNNGLTPFTMVISVNELTPSLFIAQAA